MYIKMLSRPILCSIRRNLSANTRLVTKELILRLREETNMSLASCRKALLEACNDYSVAKSILDSSPWVKLEVAKDSYAREEAKLEHGAVGIYQSDETTHLIALNCKTDFVARSPLFAQLGEDISMISMDLPTTNLASKIALVSKLVKEPISIKAVISIPKGDPTSIFGQYLHGRLPNGMGSIGVVVELTGGMGSPALQVLANKIASHVAGCNPTDVTEALNQEYLFSNCGERVQDVLSKLGVELRRFYRVDGNS